MNSKMRTTIALTRGPNVRKPDFATCEPQRCRSDCAFAQSDQHLCYPLSEIYSNQTYSMKNISD